VEATFDKDHQQKPMQCAITNDKITLLFITTSITQLLEWVKENLSRFYKANTMLA
jgi:hypothetical protein